MYNDARWWCIISHRDVWWLWWCVMMDDDVWRRWWCIMMMPDIVWLMIQTCWSMVMHDDVRCMMQISCSDYIFLIALDLNVQAEQPGPAVDRANIEQAPCPSKWTNPWPMGSRVCPAFLGCPWGIGLGVLRDWPGCPRGLAWVVWVGGVSVPGRFNLGPRAPLAKARQD